MTITKKLELEEHKTFSKKPLILSVFVLVVLALLQIWANNILVTNGAKFDSIGRLEQSLQLENQILENKVAKLSSLDTIATSSSALGLVPTKDVQYLH